MFRDSSVLPRKMLRNFWMNVLCNFNFRCMHMFPRICKPIRTIEFGRNASVLLIELGLLYFFTPWIIDWGLWCALIIRVHVLQKGWNGMLNWSWRLKYSIVSALVVDVFCHLKMLWFLCFMYLLICGITLYICFIFLYLDWLLISKYWNLRRRGLRDCVYC